MRRITISVNDSLADEFDELIDTHGYGSRSEAFRDLVRGSLEKERTKTHQARYCIASLSYLYNHHERELASRLTALQHEHHDICVSSMHVHLDHDNCIETVVLRGLYKQVSAFANNVMAQTGVRHGHINIVPVDVASPSPTHHRHAHFHPKT